MDNLKHKYCIDLIIYNHISNRALMKTLTTCLFLFCAAYMSAQTGKSASSVKWNASTQSDIPERFIIHRATITPFVENDTTFLYKKTHQEGKYTTNTKIYIDKKEWNSEAYRRWLSYTSLDSLTLASLSKRLEPLKKKYPESLAKHSLHGCPQTWIPLCSFQGKLYLYDGNNQLQFNDPLFITNSMEITPYLIRSFNQVSPTHYRGQLCSEYGNLPFDGSLDLYMIDAKRKVAIIREGGKYKEYALYVAKETAHLFDMINWRCDEEPEGDEIEFDKINYPKLIAGQE